LIRFCVIVFALAACASGSTDSITNATTKTSTVTTNTSGAPTELSFTLAVSGDILPHSRLWQGAKRNAIANGIVDKDGDGYDFRPMFALVKPILSSIDLAICHLETPIAPPDEELSTFPFFGVPSEISDALAYAGFDRCSTASNHAMDRGIRGIDATLNALDRVGISHTGMARIPDEINPTLIYVNGIAIAHMSYTFSYNGLPAANGETWRSALIDTDRILNDVRQARKLGAQVVLLSMHWGNERESTPSSYQTKIADAITKSGEVDLIIGSHAHVLQPINMVNGTWVIYGLGNFLSDMPTTPKDPPWPASTQDGAIVTTKIAVAADGEVLVAKPTVIPTWVDRNSGWQIRSVISDLKSKDINSFTRAELQASLKRTTSVLGEYIRE
jgi:poly-gamma-glutamate synthesis protein (capsule biosynthesis protein)